MSNEEIFQTMKDLVSEQFGMELDEVTLETSFEDDLGADSVDLVELVMAMEEEFELGQTAEDEVKAIKTVGDAVNYVAGKLNGYLAGTPRAERGFLLGVDDMRDLEKKLNYTFRNQALLEEALNHSSYANEHRAGGLRSNERLEFLGDSVLGFVTAEFLFCQHPDLPEGDLTRIRAALVCEQSLYEVAQKLGLGQYLKLGRGEEAGGGRERISILADATEAVFAAVYLDGGIEAASALIHRCLLDAEKEEVVEERRRDYKTALQELVQRQADQVLTYHMTGEAGPDHDKTFQAEVQLNGLPIGAGSGHSKKEAEQAAAKAALETLEET